MLSNAPRYRPLQEWHREYVGDLKRDFDSLMELSPVYRAGDLRAPVMIIQGSKDETVDADHAYRLRAMLEADGKPFEWLEVPKMGHGPNLEQWQVIARALRWFVVCHLDESSPERRIAWRGRRCDRGASQQASRP
jgi:dipeptidyl aminopeptidase/acylaminoacyl peptidase